MMSFETRIKNIEKLIFTKNEPLPDAIIIQIENCSSDAGPEGAVTTLIHGEATYRRADGETFEEFKTRAVNDARKSLPVGGIPCFLANGLLNSINDLVL